MGVEVKAVEELDLSSLVVLRCLPVRSAGEWLRSLAAWSGWPGCFGLERRLRGGGMWPGGGTRPSERAWPGDWAVRAGPADGFSAGAPKLGGRLPSSAACVVGRSTRLPMGELSGGELASFSRALNESDLCRRRGAAGADLAPRLVEEADLAVVHWASWAGAAGLWGWCDGPGGRLRALASDGSGSGQLV